MYFHEKIISILEHQNEQNIKKIPLWTSYQANKIHFSVGNVSFILVDEAPPSGRTCPDQEVLWRL